MKLFKAFYVYLENGEFKLGQPVIINMDHVVKFTKASIKTSSEFGNRTIYWVDTTNDHTGNLLEVVSRFLDEQMEDVR